ncbi:hypothetical protein QYF36_015867 [Acer negundo]|nr:hypothetical protein QYF36_015867 [Acer negundo]
MEEGTEEAQLLEVSQNNEVQISNKRGNDSGKVESLSVKSIYFKLRKDIVNSKISRFGRGDNLSLQADRNFGVGISKWALCCGLEEKEGGLKVDGSGRALVERASSNSKRLTQSLNMKVQSGKMSDFDPASSKLIADVGKARRKIGDALSEQGIFDELKKSLEEVIDNGVGRDASSFKDGEVGYVVPMLELFYSLIQPNNGITMNFWPEKATLQATSVDSLVQASLVLNKYFSLYACNSPCSYALNNDEF